MRHLADQPIGDIPGCVVGQIDRIGPGWRGGVLAAVEDRPRDADRVACLGAAAEEDRIRIHLQVGRRRHHEQRWQTGGRVVALSRAFEHLAPAAAPGRVDDDEDVIGAVDVERRAQCLADGIAVTDRQGADMPIQLHVAVTVQIEQRIA